MSATIRDYAAHVLNEPAPCDDCRHRERCADTGEACKAFSAYVKREPWRHLIDREPTRKRGRALGMKGK